MTKSRRLSGVALFRAFAAGRSGSLAVGMKKQLKAVWSCTFLSHRSGPLGEPRGRCGKAAGSGRAGIFFRGTSPKADGAFRGGLTQSRRLSGGNIFSRYISEGWWCLSWSIDQKLEAIWSQRFFRVHLRRLAGLFVGDQPKAESHLA